MIMNLRKRIRLNNFFFAGALVMPAMYIYTSEVRFMFIGWVMLFGQGVLLLITKREIKRLRKLANERTNERRTPPD